ncbi:hypothetical protein D3C80_2137160 [compost metagenome]
MTASNAAAATKPDLRTLALNPSVNHLVNMVRNLHYCWIVSRHADSDLLLPDNLPEYRHDLSAHLGIQLRSGLIRQ